MQRSQLGRRDHVAAPDERRRFSFDRDRPQLMKRESDIVTSAGIIKDVRRLIRSACAAAAVGRSEGYNALTVRIEKFPVKLGWQRTGDASNARGSQQSRELAADLSLVAQ